MRQDSIFLAQSDTTAGLLSKNPQILNLCKSRPESQPLLIESSHLSGLKKLVRVPNKHKNTIRKAKNSTFIYPNGKAVRVVKDRLHSRFLLDFQMLYSTSANPTGKSFSKQWANSTFIYPNGKAVRVVKDRLHSRFLLDFQMLYSTSANPTGKSFSKQWAYEVCDVIVCDKRGFKESSPSKMYKINKLKIQRRR